jgi:hypothetical protein
MKGGGQYPLASGPVELRLCMRGCAASWLANLLSNSRSLAYRVNLLFEVSGVRCPRCGNENSDGNRFCGMCGASLIAAPQPAAAAPPARSEKKEESAGGRFAEEPRLPSRPSPARPPETPLSGPSFLGLNKPGDGQRGRDLHGRSSRSVDYLLEDDEDNEPNGGRGKIALVFIALVLAGVFGYMYWRQGGFDWVLKGNKAAPAAQSAPAESAPNAASNPAASDSGANTPAATPNAADGNSANPPAANNTAATPVPSNPGAATSPAAQAAAPADNTASQTPTPAPDNNPSGTNAVTPAAEKSSTDKSAAGKSSDADDDEAKSEPAETAKPAAKKIRKPTPATPLDIGAEADRYIYGRGVPQDCDRGLRLLKSAAQYDPKAMIQLGVLYSSGTCAPRDLPTAYRWFAMALHKDPNNQAVQDDLQQLWGQMTQPERQLAIKLSQ